MNKQKNLKIFTKNIEEKAVMQIDNLLNQEAFKNAKVRIMPDVHAGAGCVIGFTADLGNKVIPNVVGVDIGCGMFWVKTTLKESDVDLKKIDEVIRKYIPSGKNAHSEPIESKYAPDITELHCYQQLASKDHIVRSMGTLGGGNHFIEIDKDQNEHLVFVIHSGSRNLGKQVCEIYQNKAIKRCYKDTIKALKEQAIINLKASGQSELISQTLKEIDKREKAKVVTKELCYLEGKDAEEYLHDMRICQKWASANRYEMMSILLDKAGLGVQLDMHETIHNYISDDNIVRKGAISAQKGELVLIPINMRDGSIIARGKGNIDWNCSAPHGAGRIMSRHAARKKLNLDEYKKTMENVYTTSVDESTIDEAPMVYKPMQEIIDNMKETVDVVEIIKPIYNFKAGE